MIYIMAVAFAAIGLFASEDRGWLMIVSVICYCTSRVLERMEEK